MFEQSILANVSAASKSKALAASFGIQAVGIVIMVAVPLFFADRLPHMPLFTPLAPPRPISEPPVQRAERTTSSPTSQSTIRTPRVFSETMFHRPSQVSGPVVLSDAGLEIADSGAYQPGVPGGISSDRAFTEVPVAAPSHIPVVAMPKPAAKPQRVGGEVQAAKLIRKVIPQYPQMAKLARVSGTVKLTGVIAKDGTIEHLELISGNPLLVPAAIAAVKQWIYSPTFLNGDPVEVIAPIDVIFTLQ